ncbi:HAD family phosphatase [Candidatus Woesearchaeota archaeon]|nr:HAD family phosphatase [Candidatus Woesearchaeota archaeon]
MKSFIFDMDNTLVGTEHLHHRAMELAFRFYGKRVDISSFPNFAGAKQIERMASLAEVVKPIINSPASYDAGERFVVMFNYCSELSLRFNSQVRYGPDSRKWETLSDGEKKEFVEELDSVRKMIYFYLLSGHDVRPFLGSEKTSCVKPLPGVEEFLKKTTLPKAVASSSSMEEIVRTLAHTGIYKYFGTFASGYEVERGKPSPEVFLKAAERLGAKPEDCLVFEDSRNGVLAAKAAKMRCIAIPYKGANEDLSLADLVVKSFEDISEEMLSKLNLL